MYRQSRLRIATENIGLAQLSEGLELVRIGTPPKLELAGWRYGDQFGRRRRKYLARTGIGMVIAGLPMLGWMGAAVSLAGSGLVLTHSVASMIRSRRDVRVPRVFFPDEAGNLLPLSVHDAWSAKLVPYRATGEWYLSVQHRQLDSADASTRLSRRAGRDQAPSSSVHQLMYTAAETQTRWSTSGSNPITGLPAQLRLAMEMVLHEEDERSAVEGELVALEQRWREAEEVAAIADSLLVSPATDARLEYLQRCNRG